MRLITLVTTLALAACVSTDATSIPSQPYSPPNDLGMEQWDACSEFGELEISSIDDEGNLWVRELSGSTPSSRFLNCTSRIRFKQIVEGRRPVGQMLGRMYISAGQKPDGILSDVMGRFPEDRREFQPDDDIYTFLWFPALPDRIAVHTVWTTPNGAKLTRTHSIGPTEPRFVANWAVSDMPASPPIASGEWRVEVWFRGNIVRAEIFKVREDKATI